MHARSAKLALLIVAAVALLITSPVDAGARLAMRLTPRAAFAPATVVIDAVAEVDPDNRALQVQLDSGGFYRSSLIQLDGDQAPRTTTVWYEGVPSGSYEVRVILFGPGNRQRASTVRNVEIFSSTAR